MSRLSIKSTKADSKEEVDRRGFLIKVNHHRHDFNGTVCQGAATYDCGASDNFRRRNCAQGLKLCFDMNLFNAKDPIIQRVINFDGAELLEEVYARDVLIFWTWEQHNRGISRPLVVGAYIVDSIDVGQALYGESEFTFYPNKGAILQPDFQIDGKEIILQAVGQTQYAWVKTLDL